MTKHSPLKAIGDLLTAQDAAALLGVKLDTLYAYVSRKGIRSVPDPGSSKRLYWRADVERARRGGAQRQPGESAITLYTGDDLFYRGHSVRHLTQTASFEAVAALLWGVDTAEAFTDEMPELPPAARSLARILQAERPATKALCLFPLLEAANPRAYDLSLSGMARAGGDVLRWLCALTLGRARPTAAPIHEVFASVLGLSPEQADLVRRVLILSADHGLETATFAVRAVASTGVSPWRLVSAGLLVMSGRRSRIAHFGQVERIVGEVLESETPTDPVVRRVRESERLPGFQSAEAFAADARVRILHERLRTTMGSDASFERIEAAAKAARSFLGVEPTFAYFSTFVWRTVGVLQREGPFMLGRSAGWIAHAIEQYQAGERERAELHYRGPLPVSARNSSATDLLKD